MCASAGGWGAGMPMRSMPSRSSTMRMRRWRVLRAAPSPPAARPGRSPTSAEVDRDRPGRPAPRRKRRQDDLDHVRSAAASGIVVVAVLFDAIHPPVGRLERLSADAEPSEITCALGMVARSACRCRPRRRRSRHRRHRLPPRLRAAASAVESERSRRRGGARFASDSGAWHAYPEALATESWLGCSGPRAVGEAGAPARPPSRPARPAAGAPAAPPARIPEMTSVDPLT